MIVQHLRKYSSIAVEVAWSTAGVNRDGSHRTASELASGGHSIALPHSSRAVCSQWQRLRFKLNGAPTVLVQQAADEA
jgi:hypothetical protein